jgi:hypothetical protein
MILCINPDFAGKTQEMIYFRKIASKCDFLFAVRLHYYEANGIMQTKWGRMAVAISTKI